MEMDDEFDENEFGSPFEALEVEDAQIGGMAMFPNKWTNESPTRRRLSKIVGWHGGTSRV